MLHQIYQLVRTEKDENGNTRHIYQKIAPAVKVETRYVDENGNQLLPPKEGTQNQVNIDGYDYISTNKDNNGNTIHTYKKAFKKPVTKFVDENGNEIAESEMGRNPSKAIPGYEIITTKTDEKGNLIYVYRKKPDSTKVVTKFVDEKGKTIVPNEDGKKPKKDIKGYEFVKTETDKYGNTVHIYKKKENTKKPGVSTGETTKPNKDNKPNTSNATTTPGKTTVVPGSTTINQANKTVRGNVRTGVGSSIGALITLAGSALALFKSKIRK